MEPMDLSIPASLLRRRDLPAAHKLILGYYRLHPDAFRREVALAVGVSLPTVYDALARGRELGLVQQPRVLVNT